MTKFSNDRMIFVEYFALLQLNLNVVKRTEFLFRIDFSFFTHETPMKSNNLFINDS